MRETTKQICLIVIPSIAVAIPYILLQHACGGDFSKLEHHIAYAFGEALGISLLCLFFFRFAKKWFARRLSYWGFCLAVAFCFTGINEYPKIKRDRQLQVKAGEAINTLVDSSINQHSPSQVYATQEYGDYAHMLNFARRVFELNSQEDQKMTDLIKNTHLMDIFVPEKLMDFDHLTLAKTYLGKYLDSIEESQKRVKEAMLTLEKEIGASHFEDFRAKASMLRSLTDSKKDPNVCKIYKIQIKWIRQCSDLLDFFINRFGTYYLAEDGTWVFENDDDVRVFQIRAQILQGVEEELGKALQQRENSLTNLKNIFNK